MLLETEEVETSRVETEGLWKKSTVLSEAAQAQKEHKLKYT